MTEAHKQAYAVVVEQVIVELLEISGATEQEGDDIMHNLQGLDGKIHRHVVQPFVQEIISLIMSDQITHVAFVEVIGGTVTHIILTADEMKGAQQNGS